MNPTELLKLEQEAFNKVEGCTDDEESFYALCAYFHALQDDFDLVRLTKKLFKESESGVYMRPGHKLFLRLEDESESPQQLWSESQQSLVGGSDSDLSSFAHKGVALSVARTVHNKLSDELRSKERANRIELVLDTEEGSIYVNSDPNRRYRVKSRAGNKDQDQKRFKLIYVLHKTEQQLTAKDLQNLVSYSDISTLREQITKVDEQTVKDLRLSQPIVNIEKDGSKKLYQLNRKHYVFSEK